MKSVLNNGCCKVERPFPKLMKVKGNGSIWLMTSKNSGTIVYNNNNQNNQFPLGTKYDTVNNDNLEEYEGSVTLCND